MIARTTEQDKIVLSNDKRFAYYADGYEYFLPPGEKPDLCGWISVRAALSPDAAFFVALADKEEPRFGDLSKLRCIKPMHRFPRNGSRYYDLFAVLK